MVTKEQALEALNETFKRLNDIDGMYDWSAQELTMRRFIEQSQPVPEGWRVELESTGHIIMRAPNGSFAVINPPEHEEARLSVVSEFLAAMLAAAPKPGGDLGPHTDYHRVSRWCDP